MYLGPLIRDYFIIMCEGDSLVPRPYSLLFNVSYMLYVARFSACNIKKQGIGPGDEAMKVIWFFTAEILSTVIEA